MEDFTGCVPCVAENVRRPQIMQSHWLPACTLHCTFFGVEPIHPPKTHPTRCSVSQAAQTMLMSPLCFVLPQSPSIWLVPQSRTISIKCAHPLQLPSRKQQRRCRTSTSGVFPSSPLPNAFLQLPPWRPPFVTSTHLKPTQRSTSRPSSLRMSQHSSLPAPTFCQSGSLRLLPL